jgi:hypothetical protein
VIVRGVVRPIFNEEGTMDAIKPQKGDLKRSRRKAARIRNDRVRVQRRMDEQEFFAERPPAPDP